MSGKIDMLPFNPLTYDNLGESVARALLSKSPSPLGAVPEFVGAGIYAIYYAGDFPPYGCLARKWGSGEEIPIYVGKAVPPGARKGYSAKGRHGKALYSRIAEHAKSIRQVKNLEVSDFYCRYLVVDSIWIPLGESLLIAKFRPLWNTLIDGFGNHDPGSGRYRGLRPRWDTLHPGRPWAAKLKKRDESPEHIAEEVKQHLLNIFG